MEPLSAVFEKLTDFRQRSGQRHGLGTTLTIIFLAILSGENGLREIARWSQEQRTALVERLALKRGQVPSYGTNRRVLGGLDINELEGQLNIWASGAMNAQGLQA